MYNKKFLYIFSVDSKIYIWIIAVLIGIITWYEPKLGVFGVFLLAYIIYYHYRNVHMRREEWSRYIDELSEDFDSASKEAILNMPIPLMLVEVDGTIIWHNSKFADIIKEKNLLQKNVESIVPHLDLDKIMKMEKSEDKDEREKMYIDVNILDKKYKVYYNVVRSKSKESKYKIMLYWIDQTSFEKLKDSYKNEKSAICLIQLDNYNEIIESIEEEKKPLLTVEIDKAISTFSNKMNGALRKYSRDKYILMIENKYLENLEEKRFDILDEVRAIEIGNKIPPTLSIGVSVNGKNPSQTIEFAKMAKDIALGRGGDQAVVKRYGKLKFYGGKSKTVEKRTKVKARVVSYAIKQLIEESEEVFIMGHRFPDMDCFGAAIGILRMVKNMGKHGYIVLNEVTPAISNIFDNLKEMEPDYLDCIIPPENAELRAERESLCIVVDIHRPSMTECPKLLDIVDNVVLIDHHRRSEEFIEDPTLLYLEPYASSTCELVTELIYYQEDKPDVKKYDAEALLSGIIVDTKGFTFNTGVRTFEAASFLKRYGADTLSVKKLFQDDIETVVAKAKVVERSYVYKDITAISHMYEEMDNSVVVAAQAADDLLRIKGIKASFVLAKSGERIHISGRSMGDINVQVILEKLGGGGHLNMAGAQLKTEDMKEAMQMVESAINEYFKEGDIDASNSTKRR